MRRVTFLGRVSVLALLLAACAPATATEFPTLSVPVTGDTETPAAVMTDIPAETATVESPAESPTADTAATMDVTIMTSSSADVAEPYLVDQEGLTLYLFTIDTQNSGASACMEDCLAAWPALMVTTAPAAGEGVDATMPGTITRDDGTMQATYNGWPLYYYAEDLAPGDISGQGINDVWYLVSASGNAIQP